MVSKASYTLTKIQKSSDKHDSPRPHRRQKQLHLRRLPPPYRPQHNHRAPQQPSTTTTTQPNPPATPTPAQASTTTSEGQGNWNDPSALLVGPEESAGYSRDGGDGLPTCRDRSSHARSLLQPKSKPSEYLLTGIPANVQAEQRQSEAAATTRSEPQGQAQTPAQPAAQTAAAAQQPVETEDDMVNLFEAAAQQGQQGTGARSGGGQQRGAGGQQGQQLNIDFLRNSPHFQHLRQLVQQQPAMLEPILQQVAEGNPQLAQMIGQNQEQFLQLLSEVSSHHISEFLHPPPDIPLTKSNRRSAAKAVAEAAWAKADPCRPAHNRSP